MVPNDAIQQAVDSQARLRPVQRGLAKDRAEAIGRLVIPSVAGVGFGLLIFSAVSVPAAALFALAVRVFRWLAP